MAKRSTTKPSKPRAQKATKPRAKKAAEPKETVSTTAPDKPAKRPKQQLPSVGGVQVVEILEDGKETQTQYHCRMADGTTRHISKDQF